MSKKKTQNKKTLASKAFQLINIIKKDSNPLKTKLIGVTVFLGKTLNSVPQNAHLRDGFILKKFNLNNDTVIVCQNYGLEEKTIFEFIK